ncbi:MAG: spore coat protein CotJB [Firmicutes bacterium]|nr:spore coat protein CotJB [Bacillota bacterium]
MSKEELMRKIQETGFALYDLSLFLDTHPNNKMALDYFADVQKSHTELNAQYEIMFGPLTAFDTNTENGWTWINDPWPWELEG